MSNSTARNQPAPTLRCEYKPLSEKFLGDYRVYADWKKTGTIFEQPRSDYGGADGVAQRRGKLQLRGKLVDAFKDEEAKLVRQVEGK